MTTFPKIKDTPHPPGPDLIKQMAAQVAETLAKQKDEAVRKAISKHLGREDWELATVLSHLRKTIHPNTGGETLFYGDTPLIEILPAECVGKGKKMKWVQRYRILV